MCDGLTIIRFEVFGGASPAAWNLSSHRVIDWSRCERRGYLQVPGAAGALTRDDYSTSADRNNILRVPQKLPAQPGIEVLHELKALRCRATDNRHPVISASSLAERPFGMDTGRMGEY